MVGEGIQIVGVAGPWSNVEQGVDVEPGVLHIAIVLDHGLFEVGPSFLIFGLKDGPAVDYPFGNCQTGPQWRCRKGHPRTNQERFSWLPCGHTMRSP